MAKRFINPDWKVLRKLSNDLQRAFFYCWDKADAAGVYEFDDVYLRADLNADFCFNDLKALPNVRILPGERIFFTDFISINYGTLKEGYNPHKPAIRALEKNKILSLNQACAKLEEEDEYKEEDKEETFGKSENLFDTKPTYAPEPSEQHYTLCAELIARTKFVKVKTEDLKALWPVFKIQYLTGQKYYADVGAVHSHFINWIKGQKFENATGLNQNIRKPNLSEARDEARRNY